MSDDQIVRPSYRLRVHDDINAELAGHEGGSYCSPPQSAEDAAQLTELLVGQAVSRENPTGVWSAAIAGGRRVVAITPDP